MHEHGGRVGVARPARVVAGVGQPGLGDQQPAGGARLGLLRLQADAAPAARRVEVHHLGALQPHDRAGRRRVHVHRTRQADGAALLHVHLRGPVYVGLGRCNNGARARATSTSVPDAPAPHTRTAPTLDGRAVTHTPPISPSPPHSQSLPTETSSTSHAGWTLFTKFRRIGSADLIGGEHFEGMEDGRVGTLSFIVGDTFTILVQPPRPAPVQLLCSYCEKGFSDSAKKKIVDSWSMVF